MAKDTSTSPTAFQLVTLTLYQPNAVLTERLPDVQELAALSKAISALASTAFPAGSAPREVDVVVVVKPGKRARFWLVSPWSDAADAWLLSQLETLPAPMVHGPVMFSVIGSVSGAPTCAAARPFSPPIPEEWRAALAQSAGPLVLPDGLLPLVWPD